MSELKQAYGDSSKATFIVPPDEVSRQQCLEVEYLASDWLKKKCHIFYSRDYALNTIASVYLEEFFGFLAMANTEGSIFHEKTISLNGIITATSSMKEDEEAEKEGNINLFIQFGKLYYYLEDMEKDLREFSYSEKDKFKVVIPNPSKYPEIVEQMKIIDKLTQRTLQSKYHLVVMQPLVTTTCVSAFLTAVIQFVVDTAEKTGKPVLYNISDIIECRCVIKNGDPIIHFVPGIGAKLAMKFDGITEEE